MVANKIKDIACILLDFLQPLPSSLVPPMLAGLVICYYHLQIVLLMCSALCVRRVKPFMIQLLQKTVSKYREGYWEGDIIFLLTIPPPLSKHSSQALKHWYLVFE